MLLGELEERADGDARAVALRQRSYCLSHSSEV